MLALPLLLCLPAPQPPDTTIPLWDGKAPHAVGDSPADKPSMLVARAGDGYLVRSLAQLPEPQAVCELLRAAGFTNCSSRALTGGVATLFIATA